MVMAAPVETPRFMRNSVRLLRTSLSATMDLPQAADDDHGNEFNRKRQVEGLRGDAHHVVCEKGACKASIKRADSEGEQFIQEYGNAHSLCSSVIVTNRNEGSTISGADQVDGYPCHHHETDSRTRIQ
jgi:hypothetical protein